ncbi:MAG: YicC family protein [Deltaproteobacteria bacterium]|nr:YicC family protein [Deltaproteobacteria bacterium]
MTAFGQAKGQAQDREITIEIRSVNNRFCDIILHIPKQYASLEGQLKKQVNNRVNRGRIEVRIKVDETAAVAQSLKINKELAVIYRDLFTDLKETLNLTGEIELSHLLGVKDIILREEEQIDLDDFMAGLSPILEEALDNLVVMRTTEGQTLAMDYLARMQEMSGWVDLVESCRETVLNESRERLEERIRELTQGLELDQARLSQEAAHIADRSDITEEIVRLRSHFDQSRACLEKGGVAGRRLEFLLQEINREVNTLGSKSGDTDITKVVIDLKSELEKLREQVQNIE